MTDSLHTVTQVAPADSEGNARLDSLQRGTYTVTLINDGETSSGWEIEVDPDGSLERTKDALDIYWPSLDAFESASPSAKLLRKTRTGFAPLNGVLVVLSDFHRKVPYAQQKVSSDGKFDFGSFPDGLYLVTIINIKREPQNYLFPKRFAFVLNVKKTAAKHLTIRGTNTDCGWTLE